MTETTHTDPASVVLGRRLRDLRVVRGLTQAELATASRVSPQRIGQIEQGDLTCVRMETLRKLAAGLHTTTSWLAGGEMPKEQPHTDVAAQFAPIRDALFGKLEQPSEPATVEGVTAALRTVQAAFRAGNYTGIISDLPGLVRDAFTLGTAGRRIRSEVLNLVGWLATHTHQYDLTDLTVTIASDDASDTWASAEAVQVRAWALTRSGDFTGCYTETIHWAERLEPKYLSKANAIDVVAWGQMLLRVAMAAVRNNRPGDARDAMRIATAAAAAVGGEVHTGVRYLRPFGPAVVTAKRVELEMVEDQPGRALALAAKIPATVVDYSSALWLRHRLDVAAAHVRLGQVDPAVKVLDQLRQTAPWWIGQQPYARQILGDIVSRRRTLTPQLRGLATAVRLPGQPADG